MARVWPSQVRLFLNFSGGNGFGQLWLSWVGENIEKVNVA